MPNILILSAGRRVELIKSFQEAAENRSDDLGVYCADMDTHMSSACYAADKAFYLPEASSDTYMNDLSALCLAQDIKIVIPTNDKELLPIALHRSELEDLGIFPIVSDADFVSICQDKRQTEDLFGAIDIKVPRIYPADQVPLPCFAKPYDGSSGIGAGIVRTRTEVMGRAQDPKVIFMELVPSNFVEYTIDAYYRRDGSLACFVPRQRLEIRAGEVSKAITKRDNIYKFLKYRLPKIQGARGCITIQVFGSPGEEDVFGIEINPRFGGGYPLSNKAGADYSKWLIEEYLDARAPLNFDDWEAGLIMLRYDDSILVRE